MDCTDIILFIAKHQVPMDLIKDVTYSRIVVDYRPQKYDPHRTRLTMGGNIIFYSVYVRAPT